MEEVNVLLKRNEKGEAPDYLDYGPRHTVGILHIKNIEIQDPIINTLTI